MFVCVYNWLRILSVRPSLRSSVHTFALWNSSYISNRYREYYREYYRDDYRAYYREYYRDGYHDYYRDDVIITGATIYFIMETMKM